MLILPVPLFVIVNVYVLAIVLTDESVSSVHVRRFLLVPDEPTPRVRFLFVRAMVPDPADLVADIVVTMPAENWL